MKLKSFLLVISGPSGSGKTTLGNEVFKRFADFKSSISTTTRPMREGEVHGQDYFFIDVDLFNKTIEQNGFIEWAEVHGNYYGTSRNFIENNLKDGNTLVLVIDVQGAERIKSLYKDKAVLVFVETESLDILKKRLLDRGTDSEKIISKRIKNAQQEIKHKCNYDYSIINGNLKKAVDDLSSIIRAEQLKI